jgi:hypothetical protein
MFRFIHIASVGGSSASETPNSDTCISAEQWTFHFHAPFAMRSWQTASRKSTAGSPIQGGLRFTSEVKEISGMPSGSCACHTCVMRSRLPAALTGCWSKRARR